ncbi:hypothetical protein WK39_22310 [Burkholderia cepacia]|uniref:hypothetical protein n=1 Tax=Burkholderia cepacia TaxID=292 RepID=UPI00075D624A|nr:hypothetical protein [Burkholderia cepacia]KVS54944.1 hypothetical protein WK39_22310 [Burkholderia cepacia]KVS74525.1 hypothetical protein WK40_36840 [Burkholderia cepacia]RQT73106.1 hypothetical protein DF023_36250 [Burkholderia cepacia]RQT92909.1 hypothetical protein DF022_36255 [Burkholderia cepacia]RQZ70300.1 hypothetical protein DF056_36935 [Burkholderia cepacia]
MKSPARKLFRIGCLAFAQHTFAESDWDTARHVHTDLFEKPARTDLVTALSTCATQQNPELK